MDALHPPSMEWRCMETEGLWLIYQGTTKAESGEQIIQVEWTKEESHTHTPWKIILHGWLPSSWIVGHM